MSLQPVGPRFCTGLECQYPPCSGTKNHTNRITLRSSLHPELFVLETNSQVVVAIPLLSLSPKTRFSDSGIVSWCFPEPWRCWHQTHLS